MEIVRAEVTIDCSGAKINPRTQYIIPKANMVTTGIRAMKPRSSLFLYTLEDILEEVIIRIPNGQNKNSDDTPLNHSNTDGSSGTIGPALVPRFLATTCWTIDTRPRAASTGMV